MPSSFHLPSCLAAASPVVLSPWHTTYAVSGPLAASHAVLFLLVVGSFRCAFAVFCYGHPFLQCLLAFENSFNSVGFSLVFFAGSLSFGFYQYPWVSASNPSLFNPSRCRLVFSPGSSYPGIAFFHCFHLPPATHALSLSFPRFI